MTLVLELKPEVEARLHEEATAQGVSVETYLQTAIEALLAPSKITNGAELVAYWQQEGLVGTRSDISDSGEHARALRRTAETRARE